MSPTANTESNMIESTMRALRQLSPASQGAVAALVRQLAEGGGLKLRETSPRSPTPSLPDSTRPKKQGHTYTAFNVACQSPVIISKPFSAMPMPPGWCRGRDNPRPCACFHYEPAMKPDVAPTSIALPIAPYTVTACIINAVCRARKTPAPTVRRQKCPRWLRPASVHRTDCQYLPLTPWESFLRDCRLQDTPRDS